jgi:GH25 family lysozyme M1 (1,4-beta-N-acetylmuramidase)
VKRALLLLATACATDSLDGVAVVREEVRVCAAGPTVRGIDVSVYQGTINWASVAGAGIDFAFIRTNHGLGQLDTKFEANWANAKSNGVIRGAYQYFIPSEDALAQADLLLEMMGPLEPGDLPPVIDVEERAGQSAATIASKVRVWSDRVEAAIGKKPLIYTGKYFWQDYVAADFTENPLWVAQWNVDCPDLPSPWTAWSFHQTSATGSVPGISGDVDTDLFNGNLDDLRTFATGCGDACPTCQPIPGEGRVVDDMDLCFDTGGSADSIRTVDTAGWDGRLRWTFTTDWAAEDNYGLWTLDLAQPGRYLVEVYTPAPWAESHQARYQVRHAGTVEDVMLDQTAVDGWSSLGEYDFAMGADQWVRLTDNTGEPLAAETQLVFDAVRLTPAGGEPDPDPDGDPDPGDEPGDPDPGDGGGVLGGCQAAPGRVPSRARVLALVVAGLLLVLSARRASRREARSRSGS